MLELAPWRADALAPTAVGISASRRTDIPALFPAWLARRLAERFAEYVPAGPPRRVRRSLAPADVTHFVFWSKWPRPLAAVHDALLTAGYPVLWNLTITGLGATPVEPHVPAPERVVEALLALRARLPAAAIQWRYDPVFVTARYGREHHRATFAALARRLAGQVDRVALSFVTRYGRRVGPDLAAYGEECQDPWLDPEDAEKAALLGELGGIAAEHGIPATLCCSGPLRQRLGWGRSDCNAWSWATRVWPALAAHRRLKDRPCRDDCGCSEEIDIGSYDTCVLGCRYSYGSCSEAAARRNFSRHDPEDPCLVPERVPV